MTPLRYILNLLIILGVFVLCSMIVAELLVFLSGNFGLDLSTREGMLWGSVIQAVLLFILTAAISAFFISKRPLRFLSLIYSPGWRPFLGVIFAYFIALPALNQIIYWNSCLTFPDFMAEWGDDMAMLEEKAQAASQLLLHTSSIGGLFVNLGIIALLTAFAEEIFFRGTLQNGVSQKCNVYVAIWIVALIFSTMHGQIYGFVPRMLMGAWFGYLLVWSRSLWVPVFAHFLNNGIVVLCSWLNAKGVNYNFDTLGVLTDGFPYPAVVSAVAFCIFVVCFRDFFFKNSRPHREDESTLSPTESTPCINN